MDCKLKKNIKGWSISLNKNVHMYVHDLSICKGVHKFSISCEDLATAEKAIGIWLDRSNVPLKMFDLLTEILLEWANKYPIEFRIYKNDEEYVVSSFNE